MSEYSHDLTQEDPSSLTVEEVDKFLYEIRLQPNWRRESDIACDYYDGNQIDQATMVAVDS